MIAFFGPSEEVNPEKRLLLSRFNENDHFIMLGGNFDKQTICTSEVLNQSSLSAQLPYNLGVMRYKGGFYPLLVPCGEMTSQSIDEDDCDIFD